MSQASYLIGDDTTKRAVLVDPRRDIDEYLATELRAALETPEPPVVLDVRNAGERGHGAVEGSLHIPLAELTRRIDEVPAERPVVVHCAGGYRSSVAASLLRSAGRADVSDLLGGYGAGQAMPHPTAA